MYRLNYRRKSALTKATTMYYIPIALMWKTELYSTRQYKNTHFPTSMILFYDDINKSNCNRVDKLVQAFTTEGSDIEFSYTEQRTDITSVRCRGISGIVVCENSTHIRLRGLRRCCRYNRTVTLRLKGRLNTDTSPQNF